MFPMPIHGGNSRDGKLWVIGKDQKTSLLFDIMDVQTRSFDPPPTIVNFTLMGTARSGRWETPC
ncbi:hypothetical protein CLV60_12235 [Dyadobacter jiangsuensis]|uniref:Uncharacterized protein n=1 Tax=Dyadobacter jiangsuensis TaxID=1591085 RepID=A0A2P8FI63_9BACT|nr:hypothetical protein CLV60_12235 [Dyadobacter jiangsuensis]